MEYPDGSLPSKFNINNKIEKKCFILKIEDKKTITYDVGNPSPGLEHAQ
jgi:hypothetical protein